MTKALLPGTFDPIHYGHIDIATRASRLFDHLTIGVYDRPLKNLLFSPQERYDLAVEAFKDFENIEVICFSGLTVKFCKEIGAQVIVRGLRVFSDFELEFRMALANHRLAPDIDMVALITSEDHSFLSGSTVKEIASLGGDVSSMVPKHVHHALLSRFKELGKDNPVNQHAQSLRD